MKKLFCLLFFAPILFFSACNKENGPKRGEKAPEVTFETLDGKKINLADLKGKIVMLYFWADWCPACKKEFPETQQYYKKLKSDDFELIAVNVGQDKSVSEKFAADFGAEFIMATDKEKKAASVFGIEDKLPVNFFIDKKGEIIRRINGWTDGKQVDVILHQNR